jgi:hypothetical protein
MASRAWLAACILPTASVFLYQPELGGKPLISHEVIINLIAATTSKTGLSVKSGLDRNIYPAGIMVSDRDPLPRSPS